MKRNRNSIHLIEREVRLIRLADQVWESGYWSLPVARAKQLVGGSIFFHKTPRAPSFFGGLILKYHIQDNGQGKGLLVFTFKYQSDHRSVLTDGRGWSQEMKIVVKE